MSGTRSRTRPTVSGAIALLLGALVAVVLPMATEATAKPQPAPVYGTATHVRFDEVSTPSITVPADAPGAEDLWYAVAGLDLQAQLTFLDDGDAASPLSDNKTVTVTVSYGTTVLGSVDVAPGVDHATVDLTPIATAVSGIRLTASADAKPKAVTGTSDPFDVLIESEDINSDGRSAIGGAGGTDTECNATPEFPVCADLIPPAGGSFGDGGLLSRGVCVAEDTCFDSYVQALASIAGADRTNPATLIMKCDKTLCGGGAIKSKRLSVTLTPTSGTEEAPDCPAKNTVGTDQTFCVDYVQSTRDNAGDTFLYLLFVQDLKVRFS
ncbi:MAG: hypothetical protein ACTHKG_01130 [Nocardioides sp.]